MFNTRTLGRLLLGACLLALPIAAGAQDAAATRQVPKILFLTHSAGFKHSSLATAEQVVTDLGRKSGNFETVTLKGYEQEKDKIDLTMITPEYLKQFDALMMFTTGELPLTDDQKKAVIDFVEGGKGWIGTHSATDTFYQWPDYGAKLSGAYFKTHGPSNKPLTLKVEDTGHLATKMLGAEWVIADEFYQFKPESFDKTKMHVLLSVDMGKSDVASQKMDPSAYYPLSWVHQQGSGRCFYTALGHREEVWNDAVYQQHLLGGIQWVLGLGESRLETKKTK